MANAKLLTLFCTLVAAGCVSPHENIDPDAALRLDARTGLVVGSVTARNVYHYHRRARFLFRQVDGDAKGRLDSAVPKVYFPLLESAPDAGLEEWNGRLFACELPAGAYEIHEVWLMGSPVIVLRPSSPPRFEVRAGEVVYIGALDVAFRVESVTSTRGAIVGGTPSFRAERRRDLPLLQTRFPALASHAVVPRVIDGAGIVWTRD